MKILHVIASADPKTGGPIAGILSSLEMLEERNISREILSLDDPRAVSTFAVPIKLNALGSGVGQRFSWFRPIRRYGVSFRFFFWMRKHAQRYDLVIVNGLWNFSTLCASLVLRHQRVPYLVFTHGMLDPWFKKRYPLKHLLKQLSWWLSEGPLLSGAKAVLFTTEEELKLATGSFLGFAFRGMVIGYGIKSPPEKSKVNFEILRRFQNNWPEKYLLYISRIHEKKGCDLLIDAFAEIAKGDPYIDLVVAGPAAPGLLRKLKRQAELHGIADRILWPGMLEGPVKWAAYYGAEAFVLPSHQENFGIVVAEALGCGIPVLISDKVNIWREVLKSGAGLIRPDTAAGTVDLLRSYFSLSSVQRLAMAESARSCFAIHYNIETVGGSLGAVFLAAADKSEGLAKTVPTSMAEHE